jgi:CPA2 family monovalent cation:H+ antiporter-2
VVLRTRSEAEAQLLRGENLGTVFLGAEELARGMTGHVLEHLRMRPVPGSPPRSSVAVH